MQPAGPRSQLTGRCSQSVRRLQFVPPLNTFAATAAVPDVNIELTVNRLPRDVGLVLLAHRVFGQFATATLRTVLRQRSIPAFINLLEDYSPGLRPVIVTGLAT